MLAMAGKSSESRAILWLFSPDPDHLRIRPQDAQKGLDGPAHKRLQQADWIRSNRPGAGRKFKDIDATLAESTSSKVCCVSRVASFRRGDRMNAMVGCFEQVTAIVSGSAP
jgi:hypothetical protein